MSNATELKEVSPKVFEKLNKEFPVAIGTMGAPTTLIGTFYVAKSGVTESKKHCFYTLRLEKDEANPHRFRCLGRPADASLFTTGTRFVNPQLCCAQVPDGQDGWTDIKPQGFETLNGDLIYHTVYLVNAASVVLPRSPLDAGASLIRDAQAQAALAA